MVVVVRKEKREREGKKKGKKARIIHLAREHHRISSQRRTSGVDPSLIRRGRSRELEAE